LHCRFNLLPPRGLPTNKEFFAIILLRLLGTPGDEVSRCQALGKALPFNDKKQLFSVIDQTIHVRPLCNFSWDWEPDAPHYVDDAVRNGSAAGRGETAP